MLCLLQTVNDLDKNASFEQVLEPDVAIKRYLEKSFLGGYYTFRHRHPINLHNATNLFCYIEYLESIRQPILHIIYLKLLGYLSFVEIDDPLILMGNCLRFIADSCSHPDFDFSIYRGKHSGRQKYNAVRDALELIQKNNPCLAALVDPFSKLIVELDAVFDRALRNSIAHCDYRIDRRSEIVIIRSDDKPIPYRFDRIEEIYRDAYHYLDGYREAVSEFVANVVPGVSFSTGWGPRW